MFDVLNTWQKKPFCRLNTIRSFPFFSRDVCQRKKKRNVEEKRKERLKKITVTQSEENNNDFIEKQYLFYILIQYNTPQQSCLGE